MNRFHILVASCMFLIGHCPEYARAQVQKSKALRPVDMTKETIKNARMYVVTDYVAEVRGKIIRRIELPELKKDGNVLDFTKAIVALRNTTKDKLRPSIKFLVYNRYGMLVAEASLSWVVDKLGPGETYSDNASYKVFDSRPILKYATLEVPSDVNVPAYVVVLSEVEEAEK